MKVYASSLVDTLIIGVAVLFLAVTALTLWSCNNAPLSAAGVPDAPCGVSYTACQAGPDAPVTGCCDEGTACCTGAHCPAGYCVQADDDDTNGYGMRRVILTPQIKPYRK